MKQYSVILNDSNKKQAISEFVELLVFSNFCDSDGSISFNKFQDELKYTDIEKWATDGTEVRNIPLIIEVNSNVLDNNVPNNALFQNRSYTDEEDNVIVRKVGEYFRHETIDGRTFVQLASEPKSGDGNLKIDSFFSSLQIVELMSTFAGAVINKFSEAEYKELRASLNESLES